MQPCLATPTTPRAAANRLNAAHSTGPRTPAGKHRSSLNALRHGLTARTAVLPSEDPAAYESHLSQFRDEYQPATPTESQLVRELADTSWRLNRIPLIEARLLSGQDSLPIREAHRLFQSLGSNPTASRANSTKRSISSAPSKPTAASSNGANSNKPPPSTNSTNAKELNTIPPPMASFFHFPKSNPTAAA